MLARGLSEDGAAQALGWSKARVTARMKILELPERAQQLIGADAIALSAVDQLRAIGTVAPELLEAVIAYLDDGNEWAAERLVELADVVGHADLFKRHIPPSPRYRGSPARVAAAAILRSGRSSSAAPRRCCSRARSASR